MNLNQAQLLLTTQGLNSERSKEILIEAGLLASENAIQAELLESTLLKAGLNKEEREEILNKLGLIQYEGAEAIVQGTCTKADLEAVLAQKLKNAEDAEGIIKALGLAGANAGETVSFELLTKAIWKNIAAMAKWLVTTPAGWATLAIGAIVGVTTAVVNHNKKLEESRQEMIETGKEASQLTKDLDGLIEQYRKLGEDGKLDNSDREQAYDIQEQINELLGDEVDYINLANGKYEDQLELLKRLQYEKANDKYATVVDAKDAAEKSLKKVTGTRGSANNSNVIDSGFRTNGENKAVKETLKKEGMEQYSDLLGGFVIDTSSTEAIIESYNDMLELRNKLQKSYKDEIKEGGVLEDFYNNLVKKIDSMSDAVQKYKEAMSDYNINQAVITFNETEFDVEGLGKIKGAFINSEEAMTGWITSMMNADDVSDGVQAELIALAQTWYPQYVKQINEAVEAQAKKVAQDVLGDKSLADNVEGLKKEASALGITEAKMIELVLAEIRFNKNNLSVSQKVGALKELATWAGVAKGKIDQVFGVNSYSSWEEKTSWAQRNGVIINEGADVDGTATYTYKGVTYRDVNGANEQIGYDLIQAELEKLKDFGGGGGGSGGKSNPDKNTPSYEDPTDAIINRINLRAKELEKQEESIQNALDIAEIENDYEKQISLTNDLIAKRRQRVEALNKANDELHQEAEWLRKNNPWDEDAWFDSQGNATEAYNLLYNSSTKKQQEIIKDLFEKISKYKEAYMDNTEKILGLNKEILESERKIRAEAFDRASELASSYIDSKKTLLESYYDVTNSIAEAQHEINKELETSKTMYEYLDEDTRKLLFNQEDYNELAEELLDIQYKADKLQRQYERDLNGATLETIESITSNYEMQYKTLMKSYEIAKADLEIAKKKQQLNNVLNERNVRMFIDGSWQWVANTEDVANAKAELADAEYAKRVEESGLTQQKSIDNLTKQQDELGVVINKFESGIIDLDTAVDLACQAIGNLPTAVSAMMSSAKSSSSGSTVYRKGGFGITPMVNATATTPDGKMVGVYIENGKTQTAGLPVGTVVHTAGGDWEIAGGTAGNYIPKKHADGTRYTPGGLTLLGEDGFEAYINSNGRLIPINQPSIGNIQSGGVVFNADQMKNLRALWDMSNLNLGSRGRLLNNSQQQQVIQTTDNRIIINGMTVDSGSSDGQALISALRRYVGNH